MTAEAGVIDLHCHAAGVGAGGSGCLIAPKLRRNWRYRVYLGAYGLTEAELLREGDGVVIDRLSALLAEAATVRRAVVLALDGAVDAGGNLDPARTELHVPDGFVAREVKRHANLLYGASVNPGRNDALERLDRAAESGAVLVKWLPPVMNIDPADKRHIPFYLRLAALGLPLLTHTGPERSFTRHDDALGDPERLRLPLECGVTVIAAHCGGRGMSGGVRNVDRFAALLTKYPNLYGDLSGLTQPNTAGVLKRLLATGAPQGRLLYGSDMPLANTLAATPWLLPFHLPPGEISRLAAIPNPWDRDLAVKAALGVDPAHLADAGKVLRLGSFGGDGTLEPDGVKSGRIGR